MLWFSEACRRKIQWLDGTNVSEKPASFMFRAEACSSTEKTEATGLSKTLIRIHKTVRRHIPEGRNNVIFSIFDMLRGVAQSYIPEEEFFIVTAVSKPSFLLVHTLNTYLQTIQITT
jgi:hypothetical protein